MAERAATKRLHGMRPPRPEPRLQPRLPRPRRLRPPLLLAQKLRPQLLLSLEAQLMLFQLESK